MSARSRLFRVLRRNWPILIPFVFSLSVFHAWVEPGLLLGADWVRRVPDELNAYFPWPHVWNASQQIGENDDALMSYYPLFAAMGLLSNLHVSWNVIERVFFFFPYLVLSVVGPYVFALRLTRSPLASAVAASMWTVNTWIIMATERGAIPSTVAASLLPLFFYYALRFIDRASIRRGLGLGLLLTAILLYDLRYVYIAIVFCALLTAEQLFRDRSFARLRAGLVPLAVAVITAIVSNLYWIIPQFIEIASPGAGYASLRDYILNSGYMTPQHALSGFAVFYHWIASDNPFAVENPEWYFFLIPAAVFASLAACWKKRWMWSLAFGAALAVLLDSGPTFPVDKINIWIFLHVPGMTLFRDVTKWMSLLLITYSTIVAFGVARLLALVRVLSRRRAPAVPRYATRIAVTIAVVVCYAAVMNDAYNPERFRVFAPYTMHSDVLALEDYLQSRPDHMRALIFPRDIEPMRAVMEHPYVEGLQIENSASPDGLRHLNLEWDSLYGLFSSPFAADILREMNVGYFVVPYDYDKVIYSSYISNWTFYDTLQFARTRPWLRFDRKIGRHYVFRVVDPMPARAFIAPAPFVLNGDGPALAALVGTPFVGAKTAALLPDQRLGAIWQRVHNYVGSDWTVDTNLNGIAAARRDVLAGEAQAAAARAGKYPFVAAATATSSRKGNLYSGDDALAFSSTFTLPRSGPARFSADTSDLRPLSKTLLNLTSFNGRPVSVTYDPARLIFKFIVAAFDHLESFKYNPASATYSVKLRFDNDNPIPLRVDISLGGITSRWPFTAIFDNRRATCPGDCVLHGVEVAPGPNELTLLVTTGRRTDAPVGLPDSIALSNPVLDSTAVTISGQRYLDGARIPLDERPLMEFHYQGTEDTLALFIRLRSRRNGSDAWFAELLPNTNVDIRQLQYGIGDGIHERFLRLLAAHARDPDWLYRRRLAEEPDGSGEYEITQIVVTGVHAARFVPRRLALTATPSWPAPASNDARQPAAMRYPSRVWLVHADDVRVIPASPLPGYFGYVLHTGTARVGQTATFALDIPPSPLRQLGFDIYQPAGYRMTYTLNDGGKTLLQNTLGMDEGAAFDGGSVHVSEPNAVSWPIGEPHCLPLPCGAGATPTPTAGMWKDVFSDLSSLENASGAAQTMTITLHRVAIGAGDDERFIVATRDGIKAAAQGHVPGTLLDEGPIAFTRVTQLPEIAYRVYQGNITLRSTKTHTIDSVPFFPERPVSLTVTQGPMQRFTAATIERDTRLNDDEYEGFIRSGGGLLVYDESYDNDWTLALVPASFHPSGFELVDWLRTRNMELPATDHYKVTDLFNGWWVPKGDLHVMMLMKLEAYVQFSAIAWALASVVWVTLVLQMTRRSDA